MGIFRSNPNNSDSWGGIGFPEVPMAKVFKGPDPKPTKKPKKKGKK